MPYIVEPDKAMKLVFFIHYREDIPVGIGNDLDKFAQLRFRVDGLEIGFNQVI